MIKKISSFVALLTLFLLFIFNLQPTNAFARETVTDWYIKDFQSDIVVNADSSLDITENIVADCGNLPDKHGIFRILPTIRNDNKTKTPVELVSITDFNFSPEFNQAIEQKQVAQQETEKQKYILAKAELERETTVTKAKGEAESVKIKALALQAAGGGKVLAREWIDKWDGHLPKVAGSGSSFMLDLRSMMQDKDGQ